MTQTVVDVSNITRALNKYPDRVAKFATVVALTRTARSASNHIKKEIPKRFDRPTPFTQRAPRFKPATKARPVAEVGLRSLGAGQKHYLAVQETGGTRLPQKRTLVIPVGERLNRYGKLPKGRVKRLLAKKYKPSARDGKTYSGGTFSGRPKGQPKARAGIYLRPRRTAARNDGRMVRRGKDELKLLIAYEKQARYQPRFRFRESVEGHVKGIVAREMVKSFAEVSAREAGRR